jgi:ABC-type branched-subunit amino acid transport system ATPase component
MTEDSAVTDSSTQGTVFAADNVAVHYGGIRAVDGVTFELGGSRIFGILGPNGSGKSTLLAAMTGLVRLTAGEFVFDGERYRDRSAARIARGGVARTFQTARLVPGLTVLENVQLAADQHRVSRNEQIRRSLGIRGGAQASDSVQSALERTGLIGLERMRPGELSYGTQRRVEIARAIAAQPKLLLLDEPTAGMNKTERLEISELLKNLRGEGLTQLLVEHDVEMMVNTCDFLLVMNFGQVIAQGTPHDVVHNPQVREAYLGRRWARHA